MKEDRCSLPAPSYLEVFIEDDYGLRDLDFAPDVIYDIGANVGMFTLLATAYFPEAKVISVEPNPRNYSLLQLATQCLPNVIRLNAALGAGRTFFFPAARGEESHGYGTEARFTAESMLASAQYQEVNLPTVTLEYLAKAYPGKRTLWKIDVEGEEESFILNDMSDAPLRDAGHIAMEIHCSPMRTPPDPDPRPPRVVAWVDSFSSTHAVGACWHETKGRLLWLRKTNPKENMP